MQKIDTGSRIRMLSFNGTLSPKEEIDERENYWKLVGELGTVVENPASGKELRKGDNDRMLVDFDLTLDDLGLENHNPKKNTLWIWHGDLEAQ